MSEFRIWCFGTFAGIGFACAGFNHSILISKGEVADNVAVLTIGLLLGCLTVMIFGRSEPTS